MAELVEFHCLSVTKLFTRWTFLKGGGERTGHEGVHVRGRLKLLANLICRVLFFQREKNLGFFIWCCLRKLGTACSLCDAWQVCIKGEKKQEEVPREQKFNLEDAGKHSCTTLRMLLWNKLLASNELKHKPIGWGVTGGMFPWNFQNWRLKVQFGRF